MSEDNAIGQLDFFLKEMLPFNFEQLEVKNKLYGLTLIFNQ